MLTTRLWRIATATLAASALLMTTVGGATAQTEPIEEVLDPGQLDQLEETLAGDDGEGDDLTGTSLDEVLDQLGLDSLDELLALLEGDDTAPTNETADVEAPEVAAGEAGSGEVPDTGIGGFVGKADATALEVTVGLPAELREGMAPLLEGLGIAGGEGIHIKFAETQAELQRAGEGEEVEGLAKALVTNLLLDSEGSPGACQGSDTIELPPDQDVPLLRVDVASIDCEQTDERAFADAQLAGVEISLAGLIEAGFPEDARTGLDEALAPINEELLAQLNDGACNPEEDGTLNDLFEPVFGEDQEACEALELQLRNPFDVDVPLVKVDLLGSTSEVTADDLQVNAEATAMLEHVNTLGLVCVGGDGTSPLQYTATAATDGTEGSFGTSAPDAQARLCENEASILRLISDSEVFQSVDVFEANITDLFDGALEELFLGLEEVFAALETTAVTNGAPYGQTEGAGAVAGVTPLTIVGTAPFSALPGFEDTPLGDIEVRVAAMEVEAAVNAAPAGQPVPAGPDETEPVSQDLPNTGGPAIALIGIGALGAAAALRRRDED